MKRTLILGVLIGWVSFAMGMFFLLDLGNPSVTKDNPIILINQLSNQKYQPDWESFNLAPENTLAYTGKREKFKVLGRTYECKTVIDNRQPGLLYVDLDRCDELTP